MGSEVSDETMPYSGIWLMTKKMRSVHCRAVSILLHSRCCFVSLLLSTSTSGWKGSWTRVLPPRGGGA